MTRALYHRQLVAVSLSRSLLTCNEQGPNPSTQSKHSGEGRGTWHCKDSLPLHRSTWAPTLAWRALQHRNRRNGPIHSPRKLWKRTYASLRDGSRLGDFAAARDAALYVVAQAEAHLQQLRDLYIEFHRDETCRCKQKGLNHVCIGQGCMRINTNHNSEVSRTREEPCYLHHGQIVYSRERQPQ